MTNQDPAASRRGLGAWGGTTLERRHVDGETVLHIRPDQALAGFVNLLDGDNLDKQIKVAL